jgi:hypothetical protein
VPFVWRKNYRRVGRTFGKSIYKNKTIETGNSNPQG